MTQQIDWYERRDELAPGMVFDSCWGVVKLDRRACDGTQWYVLNRYGGSWAYEDSTIEPSDLTCRLPDLEDATKPKWECAARRQGTAGGNDPADCDHPNCGCDPNAVIMNSHD